MKNWTITKHIIWRLWNQMFQYATIRAFQIKNWYKENQVFLDFSEVYKRSNEKFYNDLKDFNIKCSQEIRYKNTIMQAFLIFCSNLLKYICLFTTKRDYYDVKFYKLWKKFQPLLNKFWLYIFRLWFCDFKDSNAKDKIFYWTFESAKYFDDIRDVLLEEFTPKYDILAHNIDLYNEIKKSESVCVTIRRWDFVNNDIQRKHLYICTPKYFYDSIKYIQNKLNNAKFFIFSDDIERCRKNIKFPEWTVFERWDDPVWEKLRLMYSCKHFIISNSTFSWWAQYLSRNQNKIVCAPNRRANNTYKENWELFDIYQDNWILIDVD